MPDEKLDETSSEHERGKKEKREEESGPLALWIALVYGTGLAMNNMFLSQFGINDFSLVKPKAVFSGAIVLGSIALISAGPLFVIARHIDRNPMRQHFFRNLRKLRAWLPAYRGETVGPRTYASAIARLVLPFVFLIVVQLLDIERMEIHNGSHLKLIPTYLHPAFVWQTLEMYITSCCVATFSIQCVRRFRKMKGVVSFAGIANRFAILFLYLTATLLSLGAYMILFDDTFYPSIPSIFGGPSFQFAQFEMSKDAVEHLQNLGIQFSQTHPTLTEDLEIVHESDDATYVFSNKLPPTPADALNPIYLEHVVKLDKKIILGSSLVEDEAPGVFRFGHFLH